MKGTYQWLLKLLHRHNCFSQRLRPASEVDHATFRLRHLTKYPMEIIHVQSKAIAVTPPVLPQVLPYFPCKTHQHEENCNQGLPILEQHTHTSAALSGNKIMESMTPFHNPLHICSASTTKTDFERPNRAQLELLSFSLRVTSLIVSHHNTAPSTQPEEFILQT